MTCQKTFKGNIMRIVFLFALCAAVLTAFADDTVLPANPLADAQARSLLESLDLSRRPRSVAEAGEGLAGAAPGEDAVLVGVIPAGGVALEKFVTVTGGVLALSLFRRVFPEMVQRPK